MAFSKIIFNGDTLMDVTQDTVEASNLLAGFTATARNGQKVTGTATSGGNIPTPTPWVRPSDWPDLSKMDISGGDIVYMTSYADEARGFCDFRVYCTGSYTVEIGSISGSTFTTDIIETYSSGTYCKLYYGSTNGTYKVLRVTGTNITSVQFDYSAVVIIDTFYGYTANQGIIDIVGKLPSGQSFKCQNQRNLINLEVKDLVWTGNISSIFSGCSSLTSLDVSGWDVSSVTSMNGMFNGCYSLTSLNTNSWDVSSVTNMSNMFSSCYSLTSLNVSSWNVSSVTSMNSMFYGCSSLTSLDVSSWNVSNVTNMGSMFYGCNSLTSLDVSSWNVGSVTVMSSMFNGCQSLTSLNTSSWNVGNVTLMNSMFNGCYSLTSLNTSSWDVGNVTAMNSIFNNCNSLTSLDVSSWDVGSVTNMSSMFYGCSFLTSLDVSSWDVSNVTNMNSMFSNCYSLILLDASSWNVSSVTNTTNMFQYCQGLHGSLTLPATMTIIGTNCFNGTRSLYEWHFKSTTPPTLSNTNAFSNMTDFGGKKIYVPTASLEAYKTATNWSTYADYIVGE